MRKYRLLLLAGLLTAFVGRDAWAQRRITGKVTASTGEPIGSAQIQLQGTTVGTISAGDGTFALNVPDGPQALVVRRLGYRRTVVAVNSNATTVSVVMEKDVLQLDQMVVTGTTTSISSANAANAVATVSGADLTRAPAPTIENALQGKIPGAVITTNSGAPGGGAQVQLRGITSINASSSPLYVVDGVVVSNATIESGLNSISNAGGGINGSQDQSPNRIADLNPDDIENIEVLKGASAGAIYGSAASNGVIVITTKRGTAGAPRVNFSQRLGQYTISNELHFRCFHSAAEATDWWQNVYGGAGDPPVPWQPVCHDFEKEFYGGNPMSYETNLSVAGGNTQTTYYVGGSAKRDNAIQKDTYYQKQALTANIGQLIGSRINLRVNNQFIHDLTDQGISGNDNSPVVSPGDIFSATPTWFDMGHKVNGVYPANPFVGSLANPFQDAELIKSPQDVYRYIGSVNTTLSAYSSQRQTLDFTFIGGVDAFQYNGHIYSPPNVYFEPADGLPGTIVVNKSNSVNANLNLSGAHKLIANRFTATTSFGLRQDRRQQDVMLNQGRNIPAGVTDVQYGVQQALNENQFLVKDFSYYAQEEFLTLNDRLLLTAAINAERSSVNGDDKKFYTFPKYALSYRLPWLPRWTDDIKLRVAYGKAGNQPPYGNKFTTLPTGFYDGQIGAQPSSTAGNPAIKPETSTETEGGADIQMLGGRLALSATVFNKQVNDLILSASVAPSTGYTTKIINGGGLRNTGTEYSLDMTPVQRKNITWISRTTFANVWSRVTQLDVPCFLGGSYFSQRFGAPYICQGYSASTLQAYNGYDSTFVGGKYVSRARHISNYESAPKFTMGFSNEIDFGPFTAYGLVDYRRGGYAVDLTGLYVDPVEILADTAMTNARFGRYLQGYAAYVEPAGFVKLRELSLSYKIPRSVLSSLIGDHTHDVRLEVSGRNLKTWTKYKGYDPEVSNFGSQNIGRFQDVTPYPPSRSVFVSLIANF